MSITRKKKQILDNYLIVIFTFVLIILSTSCNKEEDVATNDDSIDLDKIKVGMTFSELTHIYEDLELKKVATDYWSGSPDSEQLKYDAFYFSTFKGPKEELGNDRVSWRKLIIHFNSHEEVIEFMSAKVIAHKKSASE